MNEGVPVPGSPRPARGDEAEPGAPQTASLPCPLCNGKGTVDNNGVTVACPECGGRGEVVVTVGDA